MNRKNPEKSVTEEVCKDINPSKPELIKAIKRKTQLPVRFQGDCEIQTYAHRKEISSYVQLRDSKNKGK